jgi:hypothetical protein
MALKVVGNTKQARKKKRTNEINCSGTVKLPLGPRYVAMRFRSSSLDMSDRINDDDEMRPWKHFDENTKLFRCEARSVIAQNACLQVVHTAKSPRKRK